MVTIGIIIPSWHYFANAFKLQPLNELYFATVIDYHFEGKKAKVKVIDLREFREQEGMLQIDKVKSAIPEQSIYLYWINKTADYPEIISIVHQLRAAYPKAKHAAGGAHVDIFPEESAEHFDAVVLGPGERSLIKIVEDIFGGSLKKIYKSEWKDVKYDDFPFARRGYLPPSAIVNTALFEKYGGVLGTSAMFSRGCNFKCAYCAYNVPHIIQMRGPKSIEMEIEYLKDEYRIKGVNLRDEICIPLNPKVAVPYLEAIGRCNVIWRGQTRVGANKEIIALASKTGCVELSVGVESASQQVMDISNKNQTIKQAKDFIHTCKSFGIKIKMCLILGLPGEPPDILDVTRKFIEETQPDYVNISGFCPMPGSELFNNAKYYGIKYIDKDWSKHAHLLFRFSDEEHFGLPFEYEKANRWGKAFSRTEIIENIRKLQHFLRECCMSY